MIATFLPIFTLQFFILPKIASDLTSETYGNILVVVAYIYMFSASFGSVLNNSVLIHNQKYQRKSIFNDYNLTLLLFIFCNSIIITVGLPILYKALDLKDYLLLLITSNTLILNTYLSVEFRMKINYKKIVYYNLFLVIGHIIGYFIFKFSDEWIYIYLCGFLCSFGYLIFNTHIIQYRIQKTQLFHTTFKETLLLWGAGFLVSVGTYIDRLIIYPILGGTAVAVYYIATIMGKTIAMALTPITGVFLSYLSKSENISNKLFLKVLIFSVILNVILYCGIIIISEPILNFLYPDLAGEAIKYIYLTTGIVVLSTIINIINPFLLKYIKGIWHVSINIVFILIYMILSILLSMQNGLYGLCTAILIAHFVKLICMLILFLVTNKKVTNNDNGGFV